MEYVFLVLFLVIFFAALIYICETIKSKKRAKRIFKKGNQLHNDKPDNSK